MKGPGGDVTIHPATALFVPWETLKNLRLPKLVQPESGSGGLCGPGTCEAVTAYTGEVK